MYFCLQSLKQFQRKFLFISLILSGFCPTSTLFAQTINGHVYHEAPSKKQEPIPFVTVRWQGSNQGTQTDFNGYFELKKIKDGKNLIFSHVGYQSDTVVVDKKGKPLSVWLKTSSSDLEDVEIIARRASSELSSLSTQYQMNISTAGIQRLACCSLAEAFENNATVDVGFADAVTGARQIQMLGLAGNYSQINVDFHPSIRLLSQPYGLSYVPSGWIHGISISKGASTVSMGHESITGQINVDLKPAFSGEKFYADYFINSNLNNEINARYRHSITKNLSSSIFLHGSLLGMESDHNQDGFLDIPLSKKVAFSNRYRYKPNEKVHSKFGFEFLYDDRKGGQTTKPADELPEPYRMLSTAKRLQFFQSTGVTVCEKHHASVAFNLQGIYHKQDAQFGRRNFDAEQKSVEAKLYMIGNIVIPEHKFNVGGEWKTDALGEDFRDFNSPLQRFQRVEHVGGIYGEYTLQQNRFTGIIGFREDVSSIHGGFFTPRIHLKYDIQPDFILRSSAGYGWRTPNPIIENIGFLSSARKFVFDEHLKAETAWNYGISVTKKITTDDDLMQSLTIDFYRTDFRNQLIVDPQRNWQEVHFYNLNGISYANSFQAELYCEPFDRFDISLAYRFNDTRYSLNGVVREKTLQSKHKALLALHYATRFERWKFSLTTQFHGTAIMPDFSNNVPATDNFRRKAPNYLLFHAQITRKFSSWEMYAGCENIGNYKQEHAIVDPVNPFSETFDASVIYAPISGRHFNFGIRYKID